MARQIRLAVGVCACLIVVLYGAGCIHETVQGTGHWDLGASSPRILIGMEFGATDRATVVRALGEPLVAVKRDGDGEVLVYVPTEATYKVTRTWPLPFSGKVEGISRTCEFSLRDGVLVDATSTSLTQLWSRDLEDARQCEKVVGTQRKAIADACGGAADP